MSNTKKEKKRGGKVESGLTEGLKRYENRHSQKDRIKLAKQA